ncbi:MAG TPA: DUF1329 domain-containing protein [Candidatus Binatia bacterium]|nr:DUF1329 domain-containing protein [Candidatus Binatia bacterium]
MQRGIQRAAAVAFVFALAFPIASRADEPKAGEKIDQSTWKQVDGLLPPEILKHYREGEYQNPVAEWPADKYNWPPDFKSATESNEGKFKIGPTGEILSVETGQQPPFILGYPFPRIDPKDPQAGVKIVWNQFYRFYYYGNSYNESQVNWVSPTGMERRTDQRVSFAYYDGVTESERRPNPQNFLSQFLAVTDTPADLNGTAALSWRYRDPGKRDSSWAYVPALRRVRAVSPSNRSDGFLGSDMSQDDGPFFDGKPEDFEWTLKEETDGMRIAESLNLEGKSKSKWIDGKGWDADWPDLPFIGYMDPDWKGVAWAPHGAAVLAKRRFWVVEGVPKDKYYLYGKLELWIDKITFQGAWNRKFDWKGELLNTLQVMAWNPIAFTRPNGKVDYLQGSNSAYQCAENIKLNRATVAGIKSSPKAGFYSHIVFPEDYFMTETMMKTGK